MRLPSEESAAEAMAKDCEMTRKHADCSSLSPPIIEIVFGKKYFSRSIVLKLTAAKGSAET